MRHATAGSGGEGDHARVLTDAGKDEAHRVGRWLASEGLTPDRMLTSSAVRCRETAQALCAGHGLGIPIEIEDRLYNASSEILLDALTDLSVTSETSPDPETEIVLLLAHNPGISHLALELSDASPAAAGLRTGFAPATVACFEIMEDWSLLRGGSARLTHFMNAADL